MPVTATLARDHQEALLVKPGSAKAIKDAMLELSADPDIGVRISAAARARVEREFTWELAGTKLVRAYEDVLGVSRASTARSAARSRSGLKSS